MALDLPFLKKSSGVKQVPAAAPTKGALQPAPKTVSSASSPKPQPVHPATELEELKLKVELYRMILSRYQQFIEDAESKSVSDLKGSVKPFDHSVTEAKISILDGFHPYNPQEHFLAAADAAIARVAKIRSVELPINFWLDFEQIELIGAADEMDKAIYLCAILRALECQNALVLITGSKKPYVLFEHNGQFHLANITTATRIYGTKEQVLKALGQDQPKYAFNDSAYEEYGEGE